MGVGRIISIFLILVVFKGQDFSPALTDSNSDEYKAIETAALKACNDKFSSKFANKFSRCLLKNVRALSPPKDTEAQVTVAVVFHENTTFADLPQNNVVAQTLVEALNDPNNSLDVSINPASVKVLESPVPDVTTTAPPTTTPSIAPTSPAASEPTYILSVELTELAFSPALTDSNSDEYKALETAALKACNDKFSSKFANKFSRCLLKNVRALSPPKDNETQATVAVVFHENTTFADLPQNNVVAQTLVEALNDPNNSLDVSINPASVKVLESPVPDVTTTAPPTTTPSTAPTSPAASEPTYILSVELKELAFSPALTDSNSDEYKALETAALKACNDKFSSKFANKFSRCLLKNVRALSPPKDNETQATVAVVFHENTTFADLPQNNVVAQTLVEALNDPNNSLDVSINPASVKVLESPVPDVTTTAPPTTTPSIAPTPPTTPRPTYILSAVYKGLSFSLALTDSNSAEYKKLKDKFVNVCHKIYTAKYPKTFSHCELKKFSPVDVTRVTETQATLAVIFHPNTSHAELPLNAVVVKDFILALSVPNNSFNLSVYPPQSRY
ncbi:hypothetical protein PBY51_006016 [Eleginops maclovinus]|uniref:SEA domain-containing protein n=1 Tax=Eleginops maclovinus TaxID=56733 RepID=A0AAN8A0S4_ELEMC|nr:hypothetical protein PBY51_006016 [Eleginops maclovinus]